MFCAVIMEDAFSLHEIHFSTSNLDPISSSVLKDSSVFLLPGINNFSFSTELFLSTYSHTLELLALPP